MSRGHNKGSGQHRKPGDWVRIATGRGNIRRDDHGHVRCPHGATAHWVPSKGFLSHLNGCKAGLARHA
jgi:hypothetical protein